MMSTKVDKSFEGKILNTNIFRRFVVDKRQWRMKELRSFLHTPLLYIIGSN